MSQQVIQVEAVHLIISIGSLLLMMAIQLVLAGLWAGSVRQTLKNIETKWVDEIPRLRDARHEHANMLTSHETRFSAMDSRFDALQRSKGEWQSEVKTLWERIEKDEAKFVKLSERLAVAENRIVALQEDD